MATAAAAAGVMHPSILAASFNASNFSMGNNDIENHKEITSIMERNSVNSGIMLLPPYMNPFSQVCKNIFIPSGTTKWNEHIKLICV